MRDITVDLLPVGRIRYAISSSILVVFSLLMSIFGIWATVTDSLAIYHGKPVGTLSIFKDYFILVVCGSVTFVLPYNLLRKYPILRASRLEVNFGGVSLVARDGTVLAEIKRATAERTNPGEVWFRNWRQPAAVARASLAAFAQALRCRNSAYFIQYSSFLRLDPEQNPRRVIARDFCHGLLDSDSFGVPLYLIPKSQRAAFLAALGLQH